MGTNKGYHTHAQKERESERAKERASERERETERAREREREGERERERTHAFNTFYQLLSDAQDINEGLAGYILHLRQYLVVCIK